MNLRAQLKHEIKRIIGHYSHLKSDVKINKTWYGNEYGGFYAAPDFINSNSIIYSFGIGEDISFDKQIIREHSCVVHGFDPTPKSIDWVNRQKLPEGFVFRDYGIGINSEKVMFHLPINEKHVSGSSIKQKNVSTTRKVQVQMKSILDISEELDHKRIDLLKMDIEGSEYEVLENLSKLSIEVDQICVEFHDRFFNNPKKSLKTLQKLKSAGYLIFGASKSYEEISLIHSRLI